MTLDPAWVPKSAGRCGSRWRTVRKQCFARDSRANAPCWICGKPINYALPSNDPMAWEPDHYLTVRDFPQFANDPDNVRPSHAACNHQRGVEMMAKVRAQERAEHKVDDDLGSPSEDWGF